MHRSTLAAIGARPLTVEFCHHSAHVRAFGNRMPVPAMSGRYPVASVERPANAGCYRFLSNVIVHRSGGGTPAYQLPQGLFKFGLGSSAQTFTGDDPGRWSCSWNG